VAPAWLHVKAEKISLRAPVLDLRPPDGRTRDLDLDDALADQFLMERYEGREVHPPDPPVVVEGTTGAQSPTQPIRSADYGVESIEKGRDWFRIFDCWHERMTTAQVRGDAMEVESLRADGIALRDAFASKSSRFRTRGERGLGVATRLVAESFQLHLENR
jgi:hypothetical protein